EITPDPATKGYQNSIELREGAKVSPLRSDTIRLVQNGCAFQGLMSEYPIQHLKDFLKIMDSIDLNGATRNTTHLRLFCFSLRDQAIKNGLIIYPRDPSRLGMISPLELAEYINTPGWNHPAFCNNGDDDDEDCTIAVTPDFPITDSLIMENEHLDTSPETESDEFIKSSVENLVPIPSESEDFSDIKSECDMPNCDDSQTTNSSTFSNPLFDDSTSSDDDSSHEEVIYEMRFKTYSNPLFYLDEESISIEFNLIHNEDLNSTPKNDRFNTKSYLLKSLLNRDESIPSGIDNDESDSEGDNIFLERLLHDDPIPLPDTLDFSYDVQVFLPFFTYPVTSSILLSYGSEDTIFDPGISNYHSLEPGVSHRSGTFMKFNIYPNHLNES
nr:MAK10-like protein [Tanacetum cinerariifolium]